ncbi:MAG: type I CRISPR-associated protein Cas7 [Ginsengibacter sp.]
MSNQPFNKRVYGCAIIKSLNANYNADFTKQPRTLPNGIVYATDKALKYTVRHFLYKNYADDKILYFTRNKVTPESGQYVPMSLREIYEDIFGKMEKVTKEGKSPKWMFYYFDGEKVEGKLQKITPANIKKYFKDLDETSDNAIKIEKYSKEANDRLKLSKEGIIEGISISKEGDVEPFFFFIKGDNEIVKIPEENIESIINDLDLQYFGGYNKIKILYNLLNCIDVRLFGATYTGDTNVSIHGPVQINHGVDRFAYNGAIQNLSYTEQIKSPVRNDKSKGGDAEMTTIGSSSKTMEAHYVHNFSINPKNLTDHIEVVNELSKLNEKEKYPKQNGLSVADINKLQEGLRCGATLYDSTSKAGVENELLIWVELKEGSKQVLPNFTELISINRDEPGKVKIDLQRVQELLAQEHIDSQIEKIDIFYNKAYTEPKNIKEEGKVHFKPIELVEVTKKGENE